MCNQTCQNTCPVTKNPDFSYVLYFISLLYRNSKSLKFCSADVAFCWVLTPCSFICSSALCHIKMSHYFFLNHHLHGNVREFYVNLLGGSAFSSEMSVNFCKTTRRYILEDSILYMVTISCTFPPPCLTRPGPRWSKMADFRAQNGHNC